MLKKKDYVYAIILTPIIPNEVLMENSLCKLHFVAVVEVVILDDFLNLKLRITPLGDSP